MLPPFGVVVIKDEVCYDSFDKTIKPDIRAVVDDTDPTLRDDDGPFHDGAQADQRVDGIISDIRAHTFDSTAFVAAPTTEGSDTTSQFLDLLTPLFR